MKEYVIGDIHGGYLALKALIEKLSLAPEDRLLFLGDYVYGWSEPVETVDYLCELIARYNTILLMGNHDSLALDWLLNGTANDLWLSHGGAATVAAYQKVSENKKKAHISFYTALMPYYLDSKNRLFIHAGFTNQKGVAKEYFEKIFYWDRSLWESAISLDPRIPTNSPLYPKRFLCYSEIFIGHSSLDKIGESVPTKHANVWNIDTGAAFKGPLSAMEINTKDFWQSAAVYLYYPHELGRNDS